MKKKILRIILLTLAAVVVLCGAIFGGKYLHDRKEAKLLQEQIKQYYENKYVQYEQENQRYADYEVDVAFLGDSLTDGYDLAKYFPQFVTANRGIGGETTFGLEKRMTLSAYELKPKVVVMLIGGNNLDTMFENYENLLVGLTENLPDTKIVLLSLTAMGGNWSHKNPLAAYNNVKIKAMAETYKCVYIDIFTPLLDTTTDQIRSVYTNDGVHLTHEGYVVLTQALTPVLEALVGKS
jgi:lysophospholipase L1-like esterase